MDSQRRRLLATLAAIGSGGLAGCAAGIPEPTGDGEGHSQAAARDAASTATVEEDTTVTQAETTATTDEAQAEIDAAKQQLRAAGVEGESLSQLITELRRDRDGWHLLADEATKDIEGLVGLHPLAGMGAETRVAGCQAHHAQTRVPRARGRGQRERLAQRERRRVQLRRERCRRRVNWRLASAGGVLCIRRIK